MDEYSVPFTCRASWIFTASMPVTSVEKEKQVVGAGKVDGDSTAQPQDEVPKKAPKNLAVRKEKETDPKKKVEVKKDADLEEVKQPTYKCKKNDGKQWHCRRPVSQPNSLCDYHLSRKRADLSAKFAALAVAKTEAAVEMKVSKPPTASAPAASKPGTSSKPRRKKPGHDLAATEGFYFYAGFGRPFRSKRQCRSSSGMNKSVPQRKQEEEDDPAEDNSPTDQQAPDAADGPNNKALADGDASNCDDDDIIRIAGGDEESSDDDDYRLDGSGRNMNGNGEHPDGKRKQNVWKKQGRKAVKARSLKSLM